MARVVRQSKYRHVHGESARAEDTYSYLRISTTQGEHFYIKGNTKFFAVPYDTGGGSLCVIPYSQTGRQAPSLPCFTGHRGPVMDFDFNPFHEYLIASGSDDTTVKVWGIPENGLTEHIEDPLVDLTGHGRKVTLIDFHPTANNILASASMDATVKIWDIEKGSEVLTLDSHPENIQHQAWKQDGTVLATSCKDKVVRIFDPRGNATVGETIAHEGSKSVKLTFLGDTNNLLSAGFTKQSTRQFKIWDPRSLANPLATCDIDQAAGVMMPFYDNDTGLLFLAGKGDGNIRYYEIVNEEPYFYYVTDSRSTQSAKGVGIVPKRAVDVSKCEVARLLKLTNNAVEPISFIVPRRSDAFQEDIYPDTFAGVPSLTADEWLAGENRPPVLRSLRPGEGGPEAEAKAFAPPKSALQLQAEINEKDKVIQRLEARVKELEEQVAKLRT